jgi:hypothetical protein
LNFTLILLLATTVDSPSAVMSSGVWKNVAFTDCIGLVITGAMKPTCVCAEEKLAEDMVIWTVAEMGPMVVGGVVTVQVTDIRFAATTGELHAPRVKVIVDTVAPEGNTPEMLNVAVFKLIVCVDVLK